MTDTIVLLQGGATRSSSCNPVARALVCTEPKPRSTRMSRILAVSASTQGVWT